MARIAIIGSGVVGKATGRGLIETGHDVKFFDINPEKVKSLKEEGYYADSPENIPVETTDAFFLTVSTPTVDDKIYLDFLEAAVANLGKLVKNKKEYFLIVGRSTMPPGTTEERIIPLLEKYSGKKAGVDFGVCMNPEYLREVSAEKDFAHPWIIVIGALDKKSDEMLTEIYKTHTCPIHHVSLKEAEVQKYAHNLYNAAKISFFNEMRIVSDAINVDADKIFKITADSAEGSWNKEYGIKNLGPFGGSCLPKDTSAFLSWAKDKLHIKMPLLAAVISVNEIIKRKIHG